MAKRIIQQSEIEITVLKKPRELFRTELFERIRLGKELNERKVSTISELKQLKTDFYSWDDYNKELLRRSFNNIENEYVHDYENCTNFIGIYDIQKRIDTSSGQYKLNHEREKINTKITNLERLVQKLDLIDQDHSIRSFSLKDKMFTDSCFLVHGHNETRKYEIARFIETDLHKRTIILHEQPNKGRTIIEKFEDFSKVDFAVALWTGDDIGKSNNEADLKPRTRQNVIFETGFFIGSIGRENVIVLYEEGIEIPSDYSGVIFIKLEDNWKDDLRKEVIAIYTH